MDAALTVHCHMCFFCVEAGFKCCVLSFLQISRNACFMLPFCETCPLFKQRLKFGVNSRNDSFMACD